MKRKKFADTILKKLSPWEQNELTKELAERFIERKAIAAMIAKAFFVGCAFGMVVALCTWLMMYGLPVETAGIFRNPTSNEWYVFERPVEPWYLYWLRKDWVWM